jgi:hypothetical protein
MHTVSVPYNLCLYIVGLHDLLHILNSNIQGKSVGFVFCANVWHNLAEIVVVSSKYVLSKNSINQRSLIPENHDAPGGW